MEDVHTQNKVRNCSNIAFLHDISDTLYIVSINEQSTVVRRKEKTP